MRHLPVGSLVWLYEPPAAPIEGLITGYEAGAVRLYVQRKLVPTPLVSPTQVYARLHEWRQLIDAMRVDAWRLTQAADAIEQDCQYKKTGEE